MSGQDYEKKLAEKQAIIDAQLKEIALLNNEKAILQEELKLALLRKYGNSSEMSDEKQPLLFDESTEELEDAPELSEETVEVKISHQEEPRAQAFIPGDSPGRNYPRYS
jgi:hypothetical protein